MIRAIPFTKMVSAGNDFLVVDARRLPSSPWKRVSRALCDRHQGIGADGLLVLEPSAKAHVRMRVFNPDGSEASMCGNGARCVAQYLKNTSVESGKWKVESGKRHVSIETKAGRVTAEVQGDRVAMRLTDPTDIRMVSLRVNGHAVNATSLSTGVPHAVVPVRRLDRVAVNELGRTLRFHRAFAPQGTNVDFIQPSTSAKRLRLRTYERGVEAETLACGTGVAASAVAYVLANGSRDRRKRHRVTVEARSGDLMTVSFTVAGSGRGIAVTDLVLEGRAHRICEGTVQWP
ncbi:MAG: diaminopimelate epimerase [Candidatus Omnitrophota bacterium]|nr:diaminopimelate epimerase [Candidatus Omnitrophota bacterium]